MPRVGLALCLEYALSRTGALAFSRVNSNLLHDNTLPAQRRTVGGEWVRHRGGHRKGAGGGVRVDEVGVRGEVVEGERRRRLQRQRRRIRLRREQRQRRPFLGPRRLICTTARHEREYIINSKKICGESDSPRSDTVAAVE